MLEVRNITKKYDDYVVLDHISFQVNDGEMVAIVGESGAGKSTLLNIIGLLEDLDEGEIIYDSQSIIYNSHDAMMAMRNKIAYLFQNYALVDNMNVYDNLMIALKYRHIHNKKAMIDEALTKVGLSGKGDRLVYTLSGGEQQRVALARVLMKQADVILCDEPTGNLDSVNKNIVMDLLMQCKRDGKTVVVVTHDDSIAMKCDRIIHMY